jgi:hypothetical protein
MKMCQDEEAEIQLLAKRVKHNVHCFVGLNVEEGITALEVMGISVDKESVA